MEVERLILDYGAWSYAITFVWTFFEGETFVLLAGFVAAQGGLSAPFLVLAAWLGSFAGDQCYFWIGRHFGLRLMQRRRDWRVRVDAALGWLQRFDTAFILSFRFIYGVRNFSSFALGVSSIRWQRFLALNFVAAGIWATSFVGIGFFCGHTVASRMGRVAHEIGVNLVAIFIVVLCCGQVFHLLRRIRRRRLAEAVAPSP
jgi:membrane protein DedA with SNARE-associated domain